MWISMDGEGGEMLRGYKLSRAFSLLLERVLKVKVGIGPAY